MALDKQTATWYVTRMLLLLALSLGTIQAPNVSDDDTARIRTAVGSGFDWSRVDKSVDAIEFQGVILSTSEIPAFEVEAKLLAIGDKPDHPDRATLEYLGRLQASPSENRFVYCFSRSGKWRIIENRTGNPEFSAASDGNTMWMMSAPTNGQLTVIEKGTPFPAKYNIDLFRGMAFARLNDIFGVLGFSIPADAELSASSGGWSVHWGDTRVEGVWGPDRHAEPTVVTLRGNFRLGVRTKRWEWPATAIDRSPSALRNCIRFSNSRGDGVLETLRVDSVRVISDETVSSRTAPPDSRSAGVTVDYRKSADRQLEASDVADPMLVWSGLAQSSPGEQPGPTVSPVPSEGHSAPLPASRYWWLALGAVFFAILIFVATRLFRVAPRH